MLNVILYSNSATGIQNEHTHTKRMSVPVSVWSMKYESGYETTLVFGQYVPCAM